MDVLDLIWFNGFITVVILFFILYILIKNKPNSPDTEEQERQKLYDTLMKIKNQLEKTV